MQGPKSRKTEQMTKPKQMALKKPNVPMTKKTCTKASPGLAVSHPLPRSCIFAIVLARLRHVFGLRTGAKGAVLDPPNSS